VQQSSVHGKRFIEHRIVPLLAVDPGSRRPAWQQVVEAIGDAIRSGMLAAGDPLPSVREMSALQNVPVATLQHALAVLADEGLVVLRQGRTAVVAGDAAPGRRSGRAPRDRDHDCKSAGCQPHVCKPMRAKTIRNVHSILSGAFTTAKRWEWISWNPAESAKPPAVTRRPLPATTPEDVAKVIAEGRKAHPVLALYLWLVAITGGRRGELCALQVRDVDLVNGVLHIAFAYVVVGGQRVRKDSKTHQDRYLAIDPVTCAMISEHLPGLAARIAVLCGCHLPRRSIVQLPATASRALPAVASARDRLRRPPDPAATRQGSAPIEEDGSRGGSGLRYRQ
jgi:DNA-binding transcriptional regulator YhcF (GntR family)